MLYYDNDCDWVVIEVSQIRWTKVTADDGCVLFCELAVAAKGKHFHKKTTEVNTSEKPGSLLEHFLRLLADTSKFFKFDTNKSAEL